MDHTVKHSAYPLRDAIFEGFQVIENVLRLFISIVEDAAMSDSTAEISTASSMKSPSKAHVARDTSEARRLDMAIAIGEAFDATLIRSARELREIFTSRMSRRSSSGMTLSTVAQVAGAGLYLEAHECILVGISEAFASLSTGHVNPDPSPTPQFTRSESKVQDLSSKRRAWFQRELEVLGKFMRDVLNDPNSSILILAVM